jgi:hypothetical protein
MSRFLELDYLENISKIIKVCQFLMAYLLLASLLELSIAIKLVKKVRAIQAQH